MAGIFDRYGLKEVSNVTVIALDKDLNNGIEEGDVVLYLDTLKVSTIEQTAEQVDAQGGWGNPKLITWDYGKEMTVTLEDALLSPEFMRIMIGGAIKEPSENHVVKVARASALITIDTANTLPAEFYDTYGNKVINAPEAYKAVVIKPAKESTSPVRQRVSEENALVAAVGDKIRIFWDEERTAANSALEITISPSTFPGTYKFIGDTLIRNEETGKDEPYQWVVPKGKISSEATFTMEAAGDPATFQLSINVLRAINDDGEYEMMKWIKYELEDEKESSEEEDGD